MDRPHRARRLAAPLLSALWLVACTDRVTAPRTLDVATPSLTILDAAHGGTAGFYFLAPLVPAPSYSGTFDGTKSPVVTICVLTGGTCGATVTTFSGSQVKLDLEKQAYGVNWKTKDAGLDPTKTYRIQVTLGTTVLGYADVVVVANGSQIKTVDRGQYVAVINGGMLAIRFRIESATQPPPPTGGWKPGDLVTYEQDNWGSLGGTPASLLASYFGTLYPNGIEIGVPGAGGNSVLFTVVQSVQSFLPQGDMAGPLDNDYLDPASKTSAGAFAGYVLALTLNVDYSDAGLLGGTLTAKLGDLRLCNLTNAPNYNGMTVRQFLAAMNTVLGVYDPTFDYEAIALLIDAVSRAFESGTVSSFAQANLVNGACPVAWKSGDLVTYGQNSWGTSTSPAWQLLGDNFDAIYIGGGVTIGIAGDPGNSAFFTSADAVLLYLPAGGPPAALDTDLQDPSSTSAGAFGGFVLALRLDVDFADAGKLAGNAAVTFGDLRVCGLTVTPSLNGQTVRQTLAVLNESLGGGVAPYSVDDLSELADRLGSAFESGVPSQWAQDHLVNGACT
jgi:hypothetical protein